MNEEPLTQLLREVVKYNLWFLEEGTLDIENWDPGGGNFENSTQEKGLHTCDGICHLRASAIGPIPYTD